MCLRDLAIFRPHYMDLYDYSVFSLPLLLVAKMLRVHVTLFSIGSELYRRELSLNRTQKTYARLYRKVKYYLTLSCAFLADTIVVKELHQLDRIKQLYLINQNKVILRPNAVPHSSFWVNTNASKEYDFAYVNAVISGRNVHHFVNAHKALSKNGGGRHVIRSMVAGFYSLSSELSHVTRDLEAEKMVLSLIGNDDTIDVYPFVSDTREILSNTMFFVFPADYVFLNYALLEAMASGAVPIVYSAPGSDKVVFHRKNGFIVKKGEAELIGAMDFALRMSPESYERMSRAAVATVKTHFSIDNWVTSLDEFRHTFRLRSML